MKETSTSAHLFESHQVAIGIVYRSALFRDVNIVGRTVSEFQL